MALIVTESFLEKLKVFFPNLELRCQETVQSLWSGYGQIVRCYSNRLQKTVIVKHIAPPSEVHHPRGWHGSQSHNRKLKSYLVELSFYLNYGQQCSANCPIPNLLASAKHQEKNSELILVLQDLDADGYNQRWQGAIPQLEATIDWLASFHANFLDSNASDLWDNGSYWHLDTRSEELQAMARSQLKSHAQHISDKLDTAMFKSVIHGDAKVANFCFSGTEVKAAAVDFQYAGLGVGVKDLVLCLASALDDSGLQLHAGYLIDRYFANLTQQITGSAMNIEPALVEREWRGLIPYAWADYGRFLQGWSPGHTRNTSYLQKQTQIALNHL